MMNLILDETKSKMNKAVESYMDALGTIRTGRANANLVNGIEVDYYGSMTPINQMASISIQEGRIVVIKPYDKSILKGIEQAIHASNLGLPPQNDGEVIRLSVPALTEETRRELAKEVKKYAENAKVAIRNVRRDSNDAAKKEESFTEDVQKDAVDRIQKITDEFVKKVDDLAADKEKEILTV